MERTKSLSGTTVKMRKEWEILREFFDLYRNTIFSTLKHNRCSKKWTAFYFKNSLFQGVKSNCCYCCRLLRRSIDMGYCRKWLHKKLHAQHRDPDQILVLTLSTYVHTHTHIFYVSKLQISNVPTIQMRKEHRIDHHTKSEVKRDKHNIICSLAPTQKVWQREQERERPSEELSEWVRSSRTKKRRTNELDIHTPLNHYLSVLGIV